MSGQNMCCPEMLSGHICKVNSSTECLLPNDPGSQQGEALGLGNRVPTRGRDWFFRRHFHGLNVHSDGEPSPLLLPKVGEPPKN